MNQKGFINIILIIGILIILGVAGYFIATRQSNQSTSALNSNSIDTTTQNNTNTSNQQHQSTGKAVITNISPSSGPIGTKITISGSGFVTTKNTVNNIVIFGTGMGSKYPNFTSSDGKTIIFTVPARDNPTCPDERPCPIRLPNPIVPGLYAVVVSNTNGVSNSVNFIVTSSHNSTACEYPSPPSGYHYEGGQPYPTCGAYLVKDN